MKKKYEKPQIVSEKMELNLLCQTCLLQNNTVFFLRFGPCPPPPCHKAVQYHSPV
jgi:hypothetical protein